MRKFLCLFALLAIATPISAQQPLPAPPAGPELVDRVIAVVGDTVLLLSDLQAEMQQLEASGQPLPAEAWQREALARDILEARVNDLVLIETARAAGLQVREEEINELVEQDLRGVQQRFGSEAAFINALAQSGMTREGYRAMLASQYRDRQLMQQLVAQRMRNRARPLISESEIRAFFDAQRGSLGSRPATVSLQQVVVAPQPSPEARAAALARAEEVLRELRAGGDFQVLARRFSDDPGSREHGGDLGWFRRGRMVREFENVAFAMRPGDTSGIVETEFGFHIIRVERTRAAERQARHILISPEVTPADVERARTRADSVATAVRGGASVPQLATAYRTPEAEAQVSRIPIDRLPPAYAQALQGATRGEVIGPVEVEGAGNPRYAVIRVSDRVEAGEYTLEDVREQVRARLEEARMMEQLVEELRREVHIAVLM
jgi:peptidyl-prolyl cis-trans isomerase SurA